MHVWRAGGGATGRGSQRHAVAACCLPANTLVLCADIPNSVLLVGSQLPTSTHRLYNGAPGWRGGGGGCPSYIGLEEISLMQGTAAAGGPRAVGLMKEMEALLSSPAIYNGSFRAKRRVRGRHHR